MLMLILFLVAGSVLAYISQFNLTLVSLSLGPYVIYDIPLFYVIVGSLVTGLLLSYSVYLLHVVTTSLKLRSKDNELKKVNEEVLELTKRVHQLELENEKLKHSPAREPDDIDAL